MKKVMAEDEKLVKLICVEVAARKLLEQLGSAKLYPSEYLDAIDGGLEDGVVPDWWAEDDERIPLLKAVANLKGALACLDDAGVH